jgi:membrane-associated phospholipid phosphatase
MVEITAAVFGEFDRWVWRQFQQHPVLTDAAKVLTDAGSMSVLLPGAVVAGAVLWWRYKSLLLAVVPWIALQINSSIVAVLKRTFDVARPPQENWLSGAAGGSFPSGHVANTTVLVIAVAAVVFIHETSLTVRRATIVVATTGIVMMAWTRLALNVHWLSDVLAGAIVGTVIASATAYVAITVRSRHENPLRTRDQLAS